MMEKLLVKFEELVNIGFEKLLASESIDEVAKERLLKVQKAFVWFLRHLSLWNREYPRATKAVITFLVIRFGFMPWLWRNPDAAVGALVAGVVTWLLFTKVFKK